MSLDLFIDKNDSFYTFINKFYEMNLQQLEYIVAVNTHRHFEKAAEQCDR